MSKSERAELEKRLKETFVLVISKEINDIIDRLPDLSRSQQKDFTRACWLAVGIEADKRV